MLKTIKTAALSFILAGGLLTAAQASDADFKLVNKTGYQIDSVYVSAASASNWGSDIMGRDAVPNGTTVNITFPHGGSACRFDIKVKYNDGDTAEWGNVDLCQFETISLYYENGATRAVGN